MSERNRAANECLDAWVNTTEPRDAIDDGVELGIITKDNNSGEYHVTTKGEDFIMWCNRNDVPWSRIQGRVLDGLECQYEQMT